MSSVDDMIRKYEFPENGRELNRKYLTLFKSSAEPEIQNKCIERLIKINMRILAIVKRKYARDMDFDELLSIFYDVIRATARTFDLEYDTYDKAYMNYTIRRFRAMLAYHRWLNDSIIKYPMKDNEKVKTVDVDEFSEVLADEESGENAAKLEFDNIIAQYTTQKNLSESQWEGLDLLLLSKRHSIKEISEMAIANGHTKRYVSQKINRTMLDIRKYINNKKGEELDATGTRI